MKAAVCFSVATRIAFLAVGADAKRRGHHHHSHNHTSLHDYWIQFEDFWHGGFWHRQGNCDGKKVLILASSANKHVHDKTLATGSWFDEIATPWYMMKDAGIEVEFASIDGGVIPIDPISMKRKHRTRAIRKFLRDQESLTLLNTSTPVHSVNSRQYQAVMVPGGHGVVYDMVDNQPSIRLLEEFYNEEKIIATDGHGLAALLNVKKPDGAYMLEKLFVTGFTDQEEEELGLKDAMRGYSQMRGTLHEAVTRRGGVFVSRFEWEDYSFTDRSKKLVTGQNPQSAWKTGRHLINLVCGEQSHDTHPEL